MLSFEQKKSIFRSFEELQEKPMSNNRINYFYPDSLQRGKMIATQLHPSGNGYIIGKYMDEETLRIKGYDVDPRGWINIKDFPSEELQEIIAMAMRSMSGKDQKNHLNDLDSMYGRKQNINENQEACNQSIFEGEIGSSLFRSLIVGMIKNVEETIRVQIKMLEHNVEFAQSITNIWMSAMFGKFDIEK